MIGNETDEVSKELFWSLLHRYPMGLEGSMKACKLVFDHVDGLRWKVKNCHRVILNCCGSYIQVQLIGSKTKRHNKSLQ